MHNAKHEIIGLLLICTLLGFIVLTPVSAATQSWVGVDKYAKYRGGIDLNLGTNAKATVLVDFDWRMVATSTSGVNVTGGWTLHGQVDLMGVSTTLSFHSSGWEIIDLGDGSITPPAGDILFGMEHVGSHTNLWVESMSGLTKSNVSIGGRTCYEISGSATISGIPMLGGIPVTEYYDSGMGVLMGIGISINLTSVMGSPTPPAQEQVRSLSGWSTGGDVGVNQLPPGMEDFAVLTFPVVVNSTNVVPFAWNVGGDLILWLEAVGVLSGLSAIFGVIVFARKK